jgi:Flp pilus assembly pilin Flp
MVPPMNLYKRLLYEEDGQDLIEYSLLIAYIAMLSSALFVDAGKNVKGEWTVANSRLAAGNTSAS